MYIFPFLYTPFSAKSLKEWSVVTVSSSSTSILFQTISNHSHAPSTPKISCIKVTNYLHNANPMINFQCSFAHLVYEPSATSDTVDPLHKSWYTSMGSQDTTFSWFSSYPHWLLPLSVLCLVFLFSLIS